MISGKGNDRFCKGDTVLVDLELIGRKFSELDIYLKQLDEYRSVTVNEYKKDWKTQRIVERTLHLIIEICLDIANHIISDNNFRMPTTYSDTFKVLMENGVINKPLFNRLEKMAKFRNILVHHYENIDPNIVVSILRKYLPDVEKFKKAILKFIEQSS